jgi:hypothetical protein
MNQYPSDSPSGEEQIPTVVTIDMAGKWLGDAAVAGADYTAAEVTQAWKDYHATRFPSGQWRHNVTGKVPVTDWRLALESQIQFNRELAGRATGPASSPHGVSRFGSEKKTGGPSVAKQLWDVEHEMAEVRQRLNDAHELNAEPAAEDVERERELMKKLAGLNE